METDTYQELPALAALRFILEVVSWVAIYFAWGWIPLALAISALTLFSVPGDKHRVFIRVPGPVRIALEVALAVAGTAAAYQVWLIPSASALLFFNGILFVASRRRLTWLVHH